MYKNESGTRPEAGDGAEGPEQRAPEPSMCTPPRQGPCAVKTQHRLNGMADQRRGGGGGGDGGLLGTPEAEQGLTPSSYSPFTGFALVARGVFNNTSSFHWRGGSQLGQYSIRSPSLLSTAQCGRGEGKPLHSPSQQAPPALPHPPLRKAVQPLAWPPLPKIPVGPQRPLCLGVHFLFRGPWPVNSGDQRAGSRSPNLLNPRTAPGRGCW